MRNKRALTGPALPIGPSSPYLVAMQFKSVPDTDVPNESKSRIEKLSAVHKKKKESSRQGKRTWPSASLPTIGGHYAVGSTHTLMPKTSSHFFTMALALRSWHGVVVQTWTWYLPIGSLRNRALNFEWPIRQKPQPDTERPQQNFEDTLCGLTC
jgi:hypothetical protein